MGEIVQVQKYPDTSQIYFVGVYGNKAVIGGNNKSFLYSFDTNSWDSIENDNGDNTDISMSQSCMFGDKMVLCGGFLRNRIVIRTFSKALEERSPEQKIPSNIETSYQIGNDRYENMKELYTFSQQMCQTTFFKNDEIAFKKRERSTIITIPEIVRNEIVLHFATKNLISHIGLVNKLFLNLTCASIERRKRNDAEVVWSFMSTNPSTKIDKFSNLQQRV